MPSVQIIDKLLDGEFGLSEKNAGWNILYKNLEIKL